MDIVVFGRGKNYRNNKEKIVNLHKIIGFIDNNIADDEVMFEGKWILKPHMIKEKEYDKIVIATVYYYEMLDQLLNLGIDPDKICTIDDLINNKECGLRIYDKNNILKEKNNNKVILLINHELSLTGAPIVMLHAAEIIKKRGDIPVVISPKDGPLKNIYIEKDIPVIINTKLFFYENFIKDLKINPDLIIVNTIIMYPILSKILNLNKPIIWWLHEGENGYKNIVKTISTYILRKINIQCGGLYAQRAFEKNIENIKSEVLLYGVPDRKAAIIQKQSEKIIFSLFGSICTRKGQDIFIKAINKLDEKLIEKAEFLIVGKNIDDEYFSQIKELSRNNNNIKFIDEVTNDELIKIYSYTDVFISASREDPMPVVMTEGMMLSKVCICSSETGTADLIIDKDNGFVFESENYCELANKIEEVIINIDLLENMKKKSRQIFEEKFILDIFEENLNKKIDGLIGNRR